MRPPSYNPTNPFRDAVQAVCGGNEPPEWVLGWGTSDLPTEDHIEVLQAWMYDNVPVDVAWVTSLGLLEAAEKIVEGAIENGNIWAPDDPRWDRL